MKFNSGNICKTHYFIRLGNQIGIVYLAKCNNILSYPQWYACVCMQTKQSLHPNPWNLWLCYMLYVRLYGKRELR